jgi:hypothetical protein
VAASRRGSADKSSTSKNISGFRFHCFWSVQKLRSQQIKTQKIFSDFQTGRSPLRRNMKLPRLTQEFLRACDAKRELGEIVKEYPGCRGKISNYDKRGFGGIFPIDHHAVVLQHLFPNFKFNVFFSIKDCWFAPSDIAKGTLVQFDVVCDERGPRAKHIQIR